MKVDEFTAALAGMSAQEKRDLLRDFARVKDSQDGVLCDGIGAHGADDFGIFGHHIQPIKDV